MTLILTGAIIFAIIVILDKTVGRKGGRTVISEQLTSREG